MTKTDDEQSVKYLEAALEFYRAWIEIQYGKPVRIAAALAWDREWRKRSPINPEMDR